MENGPQRVTSWKSVVGFAGWLLLMTGTFIIILGCSNLANHPCSFSLTERSLIITTAGVLLLLAQWVAWGEEDRTGVKSTPRSRLKKLLFYVAISPLVAIALAILIILGGAG